VLGALDSSVPVVMLMIHTAHACPFVRSATSSGVRPGVRAVRSIRGRLIASLLASAALGCGPPTRVVHATFDDGSARSAKSEVRLQDGVWIAHGDFEVWHPDGAKRARGTYATGEQDGIWQEWYANGQLGSRGGWNAGVRSGAWTYWYEDGTLLARGNYAGDEKQGPWSTWHADGSEKERCSFVDGRLEGVLLHRKADGRVEDLLSGVYEHGEKLADWHIDGERTLLYPDDVLRERSTWKNGLRHGDSLSWHHNGARDCEGRYEEARRAGPWQFWRMDGGRDEARTGMYVAGIRTGDLPDGASR
jgi:antitoxin component YwqK of YwqJK toxin-antitoxin module